MNPETPSELLNTLYLLDAAVNHLIAKLDPFHEDGDGENLEAEENIQWVAQAAAEGTLPIIIPELLSALAETYQAAPDVKAVEELLDTITSNATIATLIRLELDEDTDPNPTPDPDDDPNGSPSGVTSPANPI